MKILGEPATDNHIIGYWEGDMYTGQIKFGIQKSNFGAVKDYAAAKNERLEKAAVVMRTERDGRGGDRQLILVEESRVMRRDLMFMKVWLGKERPVTALTGAIKFGKHGNKYQKIEVWSNSESQWMPSTSLEPPPKNQYARRRSSHPVMPVTRECLDLDEPSERVFDEILQLQNHCQDMYEHLSIDFTQMPLPNSDLTYLPCSVVLVNQHILDGDHDAAFTSMFNNWKVFTKEKIMLDVSSYPNEYMQQFGKWAEDATDNNIAVHFYVQIIWLPIQNYRYSS